MNLFRAIWGAAVVIRHIVVAWFGGLFIRDPLARRKYYLWSVHTHAHSLRRALRIKTIVEGRENLRPGQNYLIVGNHLGYLDPILMSDFIECAYVTSMEMRAVPVLGLICEVGGCLFVERRSKDNIHNEISEITNALSQGLHVTVFPEATSTDGTKVLPFKRPLFLAAVQSGKPVLPIVIQYEALDGQPVTVANRDYVCWYGDMGFGGHFLKLTGFREITLRLKILPEIPVTPEATRDSLMETAREAVVRNYTPII